MMSVFVCLVFNVFIVSGICICGLCLYTVYVYVLCNYAYLYVLIFCVLHGVWCVFL